MGAKKRPAVEPEEPSRAAGACVLVVLGAVAAAAVFAVSPTAGVLAVWMVGAFALWRAARRMSDSRATPPPRGVAPDSDEDARRRRAQARGATDPNGVMCIVHEPAEEEVDET
ncbi:hypothetical protein [Streptomyces liliifuscus]|uniref:Uncharacterized protein n=1 Tax=Streptomyces liliifuscus TaxID=2797636 RepID=A0A7T7I863_9ACTN|nr:hypothetical protein [Streptomyces liliifuscus]QQM42810.1 hypothetical protein JEQ17_27570 [Streptomyces liliifuscus]